MLLFSNTDAISCAINVMTKSSFQVVSQNSHQSCLLVKCSNIMKISKGIVCCQSQLKFAA